MRKEDTLMAVYFFGIGAIVATLVCRAILNNIERVCPQCGYIFGDAVEEVDTEAMQEDEK